MKAAAAKREAAKREAAMRMNGCPFPTMVTYTPLIHMAAVAGGPSALEMQPFELQVRLGSHRYTIRRCHRQLAQLDGTTPVSSP